MKVIYIEIFFKILFHKMFTYFLYCYLYYLAFLTNLIKDLKKYKNEMNYYMKNCEFFLYQQVKE